MRYCTCVSGLVTTWSGSSSRRDGSSGGRPRVRVARRASAAHGFVELGKGRIDAHDEGGAHLRGESRNLALSGADVEHARVTGE